MSVKRSQELISNCGSPTIAETLRHALKISATEIDDPLTSKGPSDLVIQFDRFDLNQLNQYQVILTKSEGCHLLRELGVLGISDKLLNRYLDNTSYQNCFGRSVSKCNGRGSARLVFTHAEIVHFYKKEMGRSVPGSLTI
jgi:hypothetical protein